MSKKFYPYFLVLFVALHLSLVMTCFGTLMGFGFKDGFFLIWMRNWGMGFLLAYPTALFVVPRARKLADSLPWK
jgi:hypothetical protein